MIKRKSEVPQDINAILGKCSVNPIFGLKVGESRLVTMDPLPRELLQDGQSTKLNVTVRREGEHLIEVSTHTIKLVD